MAAARAAVIPDTTAAVAKAMVAVRMVAVGRTTVTARTAASVVGDTVFLTEALTPVAAQKGEFRLAGVSALAGPPMADTASREEAHRAGRPTTARRSQSAVPSSTAVRRAVKATATPLLNTFMVAITAVNTAQDRLESIPLVRVSAASNTDRPAPATVTAAVPTEELPA